MDKYLFKTIDLSQDGIKEISDLLMCVFPNSSIPKTPELINWQYKLNPAGDAVGFNTYYGERLVAHYVTQPVEYSINNNVVKGLLSFNTATHPEHRGKKLFTKLADKTYEYASELGYKFIIGVANANSTHGFVNKLGFNLISPLNVKFGLCNIDIISTDGKIPISRLWTVDSVLWRLSSEFNNYEIKLLKDFFIIYAPTEKYGMKTILGYLPINLLPENIIYSRISTLNPIKIWMGIDGNINWKSSCYFSFPDSLKPSPLNLIFKDLTGQISINETNLKFMSMDFDVF